MARTRWVANFGRTILVCFLLAMQRTGFAWADVEIFTRMDNDSIDERTMVMRITGAIFPPMAREIEQAWASRPGSIARMLIDIESPGGELGETERIVEVIRAIRAQGKVDSLVRHGALCASACVAIYAQGEERAAGGSSVWLFHGACHRGSNVPSIALTGRFLDLLAEAGVSSDFIRTLTERGYVTNAGKLWLSGYELHHVFEANIITRLLDPWRPEASDFVVSPPSRDPGTATSCPPEGGL